MGRYLELEPESSLGWDGEQGGGEPPNEDAEEASQRPQQSWLKGTMLAIITGCGLVFFVMKWGSNAATNLPTAQLPTSNFEVKKTEMMIDVKGEVKNPGVVRLPAGSRTIDAIKACGGFTDKANKNAVNLASKLHDEEMIPVPAIGEAVPTPTMTPVEEASSTDSPSPSFPETPKENVDVQAQLTPAPAPLTTHHFQGGIIDAVETPVPSPRPAVVASTPHPAPHLPSRVVVRPPVPQLTPAVPTGGPPDLASLNPPAATPDTSVSKGPRVSINRATVEQLSNVPGMTARLAADVVAYRRGPPPRAFTSLDELSKIPTLTPAKIDEISPYLKL